MFPRPILLGQLMTVKASSFSVHLSILIRLEGGITFSLFELQRRGTNVQSDKRIQAGRNERLPVIN